MKASEPNPPPLPPVAAVCDRRTDGARRSQSAATAEARPASRALLSLLVLLGLMVLARVALQYQVPLPACPLREMTGVPCPLCGSTRTFASLARLELVEALRLNPLVCLAACGAGALWLLALVRGDRPMVWLKQRVAVGRKWRCVGAVALLLNWLYLCLHLPR